MALKLRKEIKKSSYYVWFLGAKESKGLRGPEHILPVVRHLEQREKDVEPFKVTLQVSHKGLKIVQNVVSQPPKGSKPKSETIKHFIPHNTIAYVHQVDDVIACILLLFNPVTKCPLHVHAYRCDSLETAALLKGQLQSLIDRPENQKKFAEIEARLKPQLVAAEGKRGESSIGSDAGTSTRESESSEERYTVENARVTTLYDSVAAELRAKLGKKNSPILLPPRDYDTVHRTKGNLTGIELRRCLNANIVGQNGKGKRLESSGGSSGIGSDHPPSPDSPDVPDSRFNTLDNQSTSDEDWSGEPADASAYLMPTLARRPRSPEPVQRFSRYADPPRTGREPPSQTPKKVAEQGKRPERQRFVDKDVRDVDRERYSSSSADKNHKFSEKYYYQGDENQRREKYGGYHENERFSDRRREKDDFQEWRSERDKPLKYFDDDGFDENMRGRSSKPADSSREQRYTYDAPEEDDHDDEEEYFQEARQPVPRARQRFADDDGGGPRCYPPEAGLAPRRPQKEAELPKDRFKDAKMKFLLMERERMGVEREAPISPVRLKEKPVAKKETARNVYDNRYYDDSEEPKPRPAPRHVPEEVRYRERSVGQQQQQQQERMYRGTDKYDPKRRSMFSLIEEEHRKNSNEIARELKRRSYMDGNDDVDIYNSRDRPYQDFPEMDRHAETYSRPSADVEKLAESRYAKTTQKSPGYRHSYAEPKLRMAKPAGQKHFAEMLQRTNSSVGNNGRVGIASVHPY